MKKISPTLMQLLNILSDQQFHDGETLGQMVNITRAGVSKSLKQVEELGVDITSVKGRGYRLMRPLKLIDQAQLQANLAEAGYQDRVCVFPSISSTNTYLKDKSVDCDICVAEMQTGGRARFERTWHSPFGQNIYCSIKQRFDQDVSMLSGLALVIAIAIANTLNQFNLPEPVQIKWPNDIYYQGKKLTGILIELMVESHIQVDAIIGFGLNVNMQPTDARAKMIDQSWASLSAMTGQYIDRTVLLAELILSIKTMLQIFLKTGFTGFKADFEQLSYLQGKSVMLSHRHNDAVSGEVVGVSDQGHLQLKLSDESIQSFAAGEVSLNAIADKSRAEVSMYAN